jgi:hypothetical protein
MLGYQKSPNPGAACRAAPVFASSAQRETRLLARPVGGAATTRFLVRQHERRHRAILGPTACTRVAEHLK